MIRLLTTLSCTLLAVAGCKPVETDSSGTLGTEGRVEFAYQRGCLFGCPVEQPLLVGTKHSLSVTGPGDGAGVTVMPSDAELAELAIERQCYCERRHSSTRVEIADDAQCRSGYDKQCDNTVLVAALAAGNVFVSLLDRGGVLIDRIELEIREAERARFAVRYPDGLGAVETRELALSVGSVADIELTLYDDEGRELLAPEGVAWSVEDPSVATVSAFLVGGGTEVDAGLSVSVAAIAPGETTLRVEVPGLAITAAIQVSAP